MSAGRKFRIATRVEVTRVYEIDVEKLLADDYFDDVNLSSDEALGDRFEDWLTDAPENWEAPWARELSGLGEGDREVYEVALRPDPGSLAWPSDRPSASQDGETR